MKSDQMISQSCYPEAERPLAWKHTPDSEYLFEMINNVQEAVTSEEESQVHFVNTLTELRAAYILPNLPSTANENNMRRSEYRRNATVGYCRSARLYPETKVRERGDKGTARRW